jgi:hypothetical protein
MNWIWVAVGGIVLIVIVAVIAMSTMGSKGDTTVIRRD